MADDKNPMAAAGESLRGFFDMQNGAMQEMMAGKGIESLLPQGIDAGELGEWATASAQLQQMWLGYAAHQTKAAAAKAVKGTNPLDPAQWLVISQSMLGQISKGLPQGLVAAQAKLAQDQMQLWSGVMERFVSGIGAGAVGGAGAAGGMSMGEAPDAAALPKSDRRFADPAWREHPASVLLHQTYLMLADYFRATVKGMDGLDRAKRQQFEFAVSAMAEAMSPDNFLLLNPVVMKRTVESRGQNLVRGMQHLINDMKRGQLTHTDPDAFRLGENLAATPGKVVSETPLFQLIQYSPSTETVLEVPLIIFPPWINRFYILDLTPKKSFIKWAVDQGLSVFVVSWKSADETMGEVVWDDYIRAQIEAIDHVRARLDVPQVHTIGYCVAGTTLAATLAILTRRGEADKVKSATFFTAQVDFEKSGDLKNFIDEKQLEMIGQLSPHGYVDGRYLAAAFNALRGRDLIWNYVVNNYLLGEDYPAFDLLHWNGDVTNLPAKWHNDYLRDLYRDNRLVVADALSADGTPIDLGMVATPSFVQAGREDHIAPAESVWRITRHFTGPMEFLLAGSGHIAGVVNPPAAGKYQYWVGDSTAPSLKAFVESAQEHPGSWWPHWIAWVHQQSDARVAATGPRAPGGKGDTVIEDAPGRYVMTR